MREFLTILSIILIIGLMSFGIVYLIDRDSKICDTTVKMKDGSTYECAETHTQDGLTNIKGCDGKYIYVPTNDIKTIKKRWK